MKLSCNAAGPRPTYFIVTHRQVYVGTEEVVDDVAGQDAAQQDSVVLLDALHLQPLLGTLRGGREGGNRGLRK